MPQHLKTGFFVDRENALSDGFTTAAHSAMIIAAGKPFFDEAVQDDEQISRAHLLDLELGFTGFAVDPVVRDHAVAVTADHRLKRQLDSQIEMVAEQRLDPFDYFSAVHLESIGDVVVLETEH